MTCRSAKARPSAIVRCSAVTRALLGRASLCTINSGRSPQRLMTASGARTEKRPPSAVSTPVAPHARSLGSGRQCARRRVICHMIGSGIQPRASAVSSLWRRIPRRASVDHPARRGPGATVNVWWACRAFGVRCGLAWRAAREKAEATYTSRLLSAGSGGRGDSFRKEGAAPSRTRYVSRGIR